MSSSRANNMSDVRDYREMYEASEGNGTFMKKISGKNSSWVTQNNPIQDFTQQNYSVQHRKPRQIQESEILEDFKRESPPIAQRNTKNISLKNMSKLDSPAVRGPTPPQGSNFYERPNGPNEELRKKANLGNERAKRAYPKNREAIYEEKLHQPHNPDYQPFTARNPVGSSSRRVPYEVNQQDYILYTPPKQVFVIQEEEDQDDERVSPEISHKMVKIFENLGIQDFNASDFDNQEQLIDKLDFIQTSIKNLKNRISDKKIKGTRSANKISRITNFQDFDYSNEKVPLTTSRLKRSKSMTPKVNSNLNGESISERKGFRNSANFRKVQGEYQDSNFTTYYIKESSPEEQYRLNKELRKKLEFQDSKLKMLQRKYDELILSKQPLHPQYSQNDKYRMTQERWMKQGTFDPSKTNSAFRMKNKTDRPDYYYDGKDFIMQNDQYDFEHGDSGERISKVYPFTQREYPESKLNRRQINTELFINDLIEDINHLERENSTLKEQSLTYVRFYISIVLFINC